MSKPLYKFIPALLITMFLCGSLQAQTSFPDSLRHMLVYLFKNAEDDQLKTAVHDLQKLYKKDKITNAISEKIILVHHLMLNDNKLNTEKIIPYTELMIELFRRIPPVGLNPNYPLSLNELGKTYINLGKYEIAEPLIQKALVLQEKGEGVNTANYAFYAGMLGVLYILTNKYDKALPLIKQQIAIYKLLGKSESADGIVAINNLGYLYKSLQQYSNAMPVYEETLLLRKKSYGEESVEYCQSLNDLGSLYQVAGYYEKALGLFEKGLTIAKKVYGEQNENYTIRLNNLAYLYSDLGQYDKALVLMQQAFSITRSLSGENHVNFAAKANNLAAIYINMGQYEKALPLFQLAISINKRALGEEHIDYARNLNNLAASYAKMAIYDKAVIYYQHALTIYKKLLGEEDLNYAATLNNIATLYNGSGEYSKGLPLCLQSLEIYKKAGYESLNYAKTLQTLANLYLNLEDFVKSASLHEQALAMFKKVVGEDSPDYLLCLYNYASLVKRTGNYEKAISLFQKVIVGRKKLFGDEHPSNAPSYTALGVLYMLSGKKSEAAELLSRGSELTLKYLTQSYSTLSERDKMLTLGKESSQFSLLPSFLIAGNLPDMVIQQRLYQNELILKGMVLEDQRHVMNSIRKSNDSASLQLYERWRINAGLIGRQLLLPIQKRVPFLDSLQDVTNQLEERLSNNASAFTKEKLIKQIDSKQVSEHLQAGEAAIEFIRFQVYTKKWTDTIMYAASIVLPGDTIPLFVPLFEEKRMEQILKTSSAPETKRAAINRLYGATGKTTPGAADALYALIWKPLEKYLKGINTVYYAPTGMLHRIAFQALRQDPKHLLIDLFQLKQVLSTRSVVLPVVSAERPSSASIWGNIQYNSPNSSTAGSLAARGSSGTGAQKDTTASSFNFFTSDTRDAREREWRSLPGTKAEINNLSNLFTGSNIRLTIDSGIIATEEVFKAMDGKSPKVLHLATHGFFLPVKESKPKSSDDVRLSDNAFTVQQNPMFRSGLVLAGGNGTWRGEPSNSGNEDGILTSYEIAQLDLGNTDLVVLSACETALGDLQGSEGVIGLQRAFKIAGVKQMILSLWQVPDKETVELMTLFYNNWIKGQLTRQALRSAQLKMKEKYAPYYWAAFVLVE